MPCRLDLPAPQQLLPRHRVGAALRALSHAGNASGQPGRRRQLLRLLWQVILHFFLAIFLLLLLLAPPNAAGAAQPGLCPGCCRLQLAALHRQPLRRLRRLLSHLWAALHAVAQQASCSAR